MILQQAINTEWERYRTYLSNYLSADEIVRWFPIC